MRVDTYAPTWVAPRLYIAGSAEISCAARLRALRITHIINVAREEPQPHPHEFSYCHIAARDSMKERLGVRFAEVAFWVNKAQRDGGSVLIFCRQGISRSATLVLAVRMINERLTLREAFVQLQAARPQVEPNPMFLCELRQLDQELHGRFCRQKLTLLDDVDMVSRTDRHQHAVLSMLAQAAQQPTIELEGSSTFRCAMVSTTALLQRPGQFERMFCEAIENHATKSIHDAAARDALGTLLARVQRVMSDRREGSVLLPRLTALMASDAWRELCIDNPLAQQHADALYAHLAQQPLL